MGFRSIDLGTDASPVGTAPAGVAVGDILVAFFLGWDDTGRTITPPAGWTFRGRENSTGAATIAVYTMVYASGTTWTWTQSGPGFMRIVVLAYSGIDTTTPFDTFSVGTGNPSSPATIAALTTGAANEILVAAWMSGANAVGTPATMTSRGNPAIDGGPSRFADETFATAASTGTRSATMTSDEWTGIMIALRPAGGAAAVGMPLNYPQRAMQNILYGM